ncbi:rod shape-determining protein MreC [Algiphilus sp.]|uniref:rod shape-determining protein MreC n=1 Tax=Algiphilus sp. TaxID=1872431 RepID=UPI002A66C9E1|nr:rod shape-determining protein MreC [Pseudomonadota bacterium]
MRRALALIVLSIAVLVVDLRTDALDPLRSSIMRAAYPLLWVAEQPAHTHRFFEFLALRADELDAYEQLQRTHLRLLGRVQRIEALEAENRRLRALLSSTDVLEARALVAEVLAASQDPYQQRLTLNRGSLHGVYRGQAVIDARGVLGQIVQVHRQTASALLITDPDHGIPVEVNRTGLQTIAVGRGDGQALSLPYLPGNADIQVDDLLVSSSLGGRFPSGYPVARVLELRYEPGDSFMEAIALPEARVNQSRQVLLLWNDDARPASNDDATTNPSTKPVNSAEDAGAPAPPPAENASGDATEDGAPAGDSP